MKIGAAQNTAFAFIPLFTYLQTRNKHKFIAEAFVPLVMRIERIWRYRIMLNVHYSTQPIRELQD